MPHSSDVIVIGGGAVGSACAWALARGGARVTLLQRPDTPGEGWRASAGMLGAQIEAGQDDPLLKLALAGRAFFRRNADSLREATGIDIGLMESGILQVAISEQEVAALKAQVAWQRQHAHRADWLEPEDVRDGWSWLAPCLGGFWSPEDGAVDPVKMVDAFRTDAIKHGTKVIPDVAVGLDRRGERLLGVIGEQARYAASTVVIAGGAWAGRLENLPRPVSVEPVRGQMASFPLPAGVAPAIVYGEKCYVLSRNDELLVGATMEHAGFDVRVTADALADLQRRAAMLYSALAGAKPLRTWAGLRPGTPDGLPIIGNEPRLPGLWYATGHGRNGILLAGITGEVIAKGIATGSLGDEMYAVRATRFWSW